MEVIQIITMKRLLRMCSRCLKVRGTLLGDQHLHTYQPNKYLKDLEEDKGVHQCYIREEKREYVGTVASLATIHLVVQSQEDKIMVCHSGQQGHK
jgi:hypothetical protein